MRIAGNKPSSVILFQTKELNVKNDSRKEPKQAETIKDV